jgi:TonB family protein
MRRLADAAFALVAGVFWLGAPSLTLGQEFQGPELDRSIDETGNELPSTEPLTTSPTIGAPSSRPVWLERPEADDLQRRFPRNALRAGIAGRVVLECLIRAEGDLLCVVFSEDPPEQGFGEAALQIAQEYRASSLLQDGTPAQGARIRLPITFAVSE